VMDEARYFGVWMNLSKSYLSLMLRHLGPDSGIS